MNRTEKILNIQNCFTQKLFIIFSKESFVLKLSFEISINY